MEVVIDDHYSNDWLDDQIELVNKGIKNINKDYDKEARKYILKRSYELSVDKKNK
jgi:hypothetical protein